MNIRRIIAILLAIPLVAITFHLTSPIATAQTLDQYGGYLGLSVPGGATGHFRVAKLNNRWVFVTPAGNAFWMLGVYNVSLEGTNALGVPYQTTVMNKYGTATVWGAQETVRLKSWGFNAIGPYTDYRLWDQLPQTLTFGITGNAFTARFVTGGCPTKELWNGLNHSIYTGYAAPMPDFWDPCYADYVDRVISQNVSGLQPIYTSPYTIGFAADDRDYLFGFGPGMEVPAYSPHPHLGWIVLNTNFQQSSNSTYGVTYSDRKVYAKYAIRDFLYTRYSGSISALNAAWGSTYTTFDSAGGWGTGTGLLDEDGHHSWVPSDYNGLTGGTAAFVADLDAFLLEHARKYFTITSSKIRQYAPNVLVFGPHTLNVDGLTRKQILQAAGENVDVLMAGVASQTVLNLTAQYFGDKPIIPESVTTAGALIANPDSAMWKYPNPSPVNPDWEFNTQADRGARYATGISTLLGYTATNGTQPVAGTIWWEFHDNSRENANYGLVTLSDNAYDGVQAAIAASTDAWRWPRGGEERNYGNFLGPVTQANAQVYSVLSGTAPSSTWAPPSGSTTSDTVAITSPTSGSTVQGNVSVNATAAGTIMSTDLILDASTVTSFIGANVSFPWDSRKVPNGTHRWTAKAYGVSGSTVLSPPVDVVVNNVTTTADTTPPTVSITAPISGATVPRKSTVTITAGVSDNVGVTSVQISVNGNVLCSSVSAPYSCGWKVPAAVGKTYKLQAKAYDGQGNVSLSSIVTVTAK